jgi:ribosome maturation factor RimP
VETTAAIQQLLEPLLADGRYYLVAINLSPSRRMPTLTVLVDSDLGISIDECAQISRYLGDAIEEAGMFDEGYQLEVSSPGIETPLTSIRQYQKNVGRRLRFFLHDGTKLFGKLESVTDTDLIIYEEVLRGKIKSFKKDLTSLPISQIQSAQVQVMFH